MKRGRKLNPKNLEGLPMTIERQATKKRKMNNRRSRNRRVDRLSSLPDDILIGIISLLPLQLAITSGTLSRRWRGLWTKTTSIDITYMDAHNLRKFDTTLNKIARQITSPFIHRFSIEFAGSINLDKCVLCIGTLIRNLCDRNLHQFKVTWPDAHNWQIFKLPSVIFQTQSLVSIELGSKFDSMCGFDWEFPTDSDTINLPNLKNLTIQFASQLRWIEKLVKACPSLEELSLICWAIDMSWSLQSPDIFKCSNQTLRQLFIDFSSILGYTIVINAPNLEYLDIYVPQSTTFSFEKEPTMLREAKIEFTGIYYDRDKWLKFYGAISEVRFLTLGISVVDTLSTVFRNVVWLTFNMMQKHNLNTLLSVLEMCPLVDFLTLKFWGVDIDREQSLCRKPGNISILPKALKGIKSINIEIDEKRTNCNRAKSLLCFIRDLLRITCNLERINVTISDYQDWARYMMLNQEDELKICKVLYRCPTASTCCNVEFKGRFLKMSKKDGPKVWTADGQVIHFRPSRHKSTDEVRAELSSAIQQLKDVVALRDTEIETLKASNDNLRASNAELKSSNEELKVSISKMNQDAIELEQKLRDEMHKMFDETRRRR